MRIWDLSPAYLGDRNLLAEHVEAHAIATILREGRRGYAHHPEVLRWKGCLAALGRRHDWLAAEMAVRGFHHRSPMSRPPETPVWPRRFLLSPLGQFRLLRRKGRRGRLPLPRTARTLWRHHELSVLARGRRLHAAIAVQVRLGVPPDVLATRLVRVLRRPARPEDVREALRRLGPPTLLTTAWGDPELICSPGR